MVAALLVVPQVLAALLFAAVVAVVALEPPRPTAGACVPDRSRRRRSVSCCTGPGTPPGTGPSRSSPRWRSPSTKSVLLVVAAATPLAARGVLDRRARLVDRFLGDERLIGLEGLDAVLRDALGDPTVSVRRWRADEQRYVAADGSGRDGAGAGPALGARRGRRRHGRGGGRAGVRRARRCVDGVRGGLGGATRPRQPRAAGRARRAARRPRGGTRTPRGGWRSPARGHRGARCGTRCSNRSTRTAGDLRVLAATVHDADGRGRPRRRRRRADGRRQRDRRPRLGGPRHLPRWRPAGGGARVAGRPMRPPGRRRRASGVGGRPGGRDRALLRLLRGAHERRQARPRLQRVHRARAVGPGGVRPRGRRRCRRRRPRTVPACREWPTGSPRAAAGSRWRAHPEPARR